MLQALKGPTPFTSFIPFAIFLPFQFLSAPRKTATISIQANRWTLLIIGGTAIAILAFKGSATNCSAKERLAIKRTKSRPGSGSNIASSSISPGNMFQIASYLVEKVSSLIPWRSAASVLKTTSDNRRAAIELGERVTSEQAEIEKLKRLLEEAKAREKEGTKIEEEVEALRDEVVRLKKALEGRGNEGETTAGETASDGAYSYLEGQDATTQEEVISLLDDLNAEILEVARTITQAFTNTRRPPPPLPSEEISEDLKEAIAGTLEILGPGMVELLQAPQRRGLCGEVEVVKLAMKASMTTYTHWIISSWYFENPEDEHLLSEIYARVRETEEQAVSGRWRALTRIHLQRMLAAEPDLTIYMVDAFVNILLSAGWHNDATALQDYLIQTFGEKIGAVLGKAKRLNKAIGEEIVECDLEALYIAPDVIYNEMTMEIRDGGDISGEFAPVVIPAEAKVLCTTELGLVKAEKRVGTVGEWDEAVLLKPSVILQPLVAGIV